LVLVFAPLFGHGRGHAQRLVSLSFTNVSVPCPAALRCPRHALVSEKAVAADDSQAAIAAATSSAIAQGVADFQARRHGH
jgi:hypothetical protein